MPVVKQISKLALMSPYNRSLLSIFILISPLLLISQSCSLTISGRVTDVHHGDPLQAVTIYIQETQSGAITDSLGYYQITDLCAGTYHLTFSHIGCESEQDLVEVREHLVYHKSLDHDSHMIHTIVVSEPYAIKSTQYTDQVSTQLITDNAADNISNILEKITGVSTLKNGSGISKPVVHGLYGNRLTIINNGVSQSGQQWGNDHSPEIDPLAANRIKLIKGSAALAYQSSNLGAVVLVENNKIEREPHLHGRANYFYESNGRGHGLNAQVQQYNDKIAWKTNATYKRIGDRSSPSYYLNNTGIQELHFSLQLEKSVSERWHTHLLMSTFNSQLGILRGSHISNLTDLEQAFTRATPFFTEENHSYAIEPPRQEVHHHLFKLHSKYFMAEDHFFDFTLAAQINQREEYDIRRSGRSDIPALSLLQTSLFSELTHSIQFKGQEIRSGIQNTITDNTNNPDTGILPLIPDYISLETGIFSIYHFKRGPTSMEMGLRYDHLNNSVATISGTLPREIVRYNNRFHNISSSFGCQYTHNEHLSISTNIGLATRNPAINELYSAGLHQGVSGIEEGNIALSTEKALKTTLSLEGSINESFYFNSLVYYQRVHDYIFLDPQDEIRLTIRGAFPVFRYEQTDAVIYGLDMNTGYDFSQSLNAQLKASYIKGQDKTSDIPLIYIPANNISAHIKYEFAKSIKLGIHSLENITLELEDQYVFRQNNLLPEQDFSPSPDAYNLLEFRVAADLQLQKTRWRCSIKINNLLNTEYRDYLNRQRYFADDLGRNVILSLGIKF